MLIYPFGFFLLLGGSGVLPDVFGWRRLAAGLSALALGWLLLWSLPSVADVLVYSLERQSQEHLVTVLP